MSRSARWVAVFCAAAQLLVASARAQTKEPATAPPAAAKSMTFDFDVSARIVPTERAAHVTLELGRGANHVDWIRFRIDPQRHLLFRGDGQIVADGAHLTWTPRRCASRLRSAFFSGSTPKRSSSSSRP